MKKLSGIWLPIITPFHNDKIDFASYKKLIEHYSTKGITGIIPNGTTGECPTIDDYEMESLLEKTIAYNSSKLPIYFGLGGNDTRKILKQLKIIEKYKIDGILSVGPYYSRPDQNGIIQHFTKISEATDLNIIIYNIPYRTGRNIENESLLKLAQLKNIVGVKDSSGNINQSIELITTAPKDFTVLTGEDILFYFNLVMGGDGGIMAASHLATEKFVEVYKLIKANNHQAALEIWNGIAKFIPLLFQEPNPGPIKYYLTKKGLISSDELRLPLTGISDKLKRELDKYL